jgi:hypothetical protein
VGGHKRPCNRRRALRLEMLETRELLSTVAAPARPAMEVSPLTKTPSGDLINGWFVGPGVWTPRSRSRGTNTFTASGAATVGVAATPLGAITFSGSVEYEAAVENGAIVGYHLQNGIATLSDSSGSKLHLHFTGELYESGTTYGLSWTGTVNGGSGKFSKASGTFTAWGTYSVASGALQVPSITLILTRR